MLASASQLYIKMIRQAYETAGGDYAALSNKLFGAPQPPSDTEQRVDIKDISALWAAAREELKDPFFAARVGETIQPSDYGILGYVWMNCSNLLECFELVVQYKKLMNDAFQAKYEVTGNEFIYTVGLSGASIDQEAPFIDLDISSIYHLGRFLVGPRNSHNIQLKQVRLRQAHTDELQQGFEKILNCPVLMGQTENQVIVSLDVLHLPIHAPNPAVQKMMLGKVKKLVDNNYSKQTTAGRVVEFVNNNMTGQTPSAEMTAKHLGMSLSTLKRALRDENETFKKLLDEQRFQHAKNMLREGSLSICEISFLLGYSNASSFTRSFKVWSGKRPNEYRKWLSTN